MSKKTEARELVDAYTHVELCRLADAEEATYSERGSKKKIAMEIVEARGATQDAIDAGAVVESETPLELDEAPASIPEDVKELSAAVANALPDVLGDVLEEEIDAAMAADVPLVEIETATKDVVTVVVEADVSEVPPKVAEVKEVIVELGPYEEVVREILEARNTVKTASAAFNACGQVAGPERDARRAAKAALYALL